MALVDLFADDGIFELPFALDSTKSKFEGIAKMRERNSESSQMGKLIEVHKVSTVIHESIDPEIVIAEFTISGKSPTTDELFCLPSIGVIRIRNGKIIHYRDYLNTLQGVKITGMMQQFAASLIK